MWAIRWLAAAVLGVIALGFVAAGTLTLFFRDWHPTRPLYSDDFGRIKAAATFVESSAKSLGRMPSREEFGEWSRVAPSELRLEGVGFTYAPSSSSSGSAYSFAWYGGRGTWLSWRSDASDPARADIAPEVYFVLGSKLSDLAASFGVAVLLFLVAGHIVRADNARHDR